MLVLLKGAAVFLVIGLALYLGLLGFAILVCLVVFRLVWKDVQW